MTTFTAILGASGIPDTSPEGIAQVTRERERTLTILRTVSLRETMEFKSEQVTDENGNVYYDYAGIVHSRWTDKDGVIHLGINGDIVRVVLPV